MAVTRFSPTPDAWAHLGHGHTALEGDSVSDGTWLIFENMAARMNMKPWVSQPRIEASMEDFATQLPRCGVRVLGTILQSDWVPELEAINRSEFNGRLSWRTPRWIMEQPALIEKCNGHGYMSPSMNHLSQVVIDHHLGVRDIFRGGELIFHRAAYQLLWEALYGNEPEYMRPYLHYVAEVTQTSFVDEAGKQKLSKSQTRCFFLRDVENPFPVMRNLELKMKQENEVSGYWADIKDWEGLRRWVALSTRRGDPESITAEEVWSWSSE